MRPLSRSHHVVLAMAGTRGGAPNVPWMSDRTVQAIVTAGVGLLAVIAVRWGLGVAMARYERRLAPREPAEAARRRTTLLFLRRVIVALVAVIAVWNVLTLYPQTDKIVNTLLASSAVIAIFVGLAFNTPLSNLGSGLLVAFAQPLRLGDRVTVGEHTGFVEEMNLLYTTLVTDEARRVYIPNSQLTSAMIVNRTIRDPRRVVSAEFPIRLGASLEGARDTVLGAVDGLAGVRPGQTRVLVGDVKNGAVWLTVTASAPLDADVAQLGSDLRATVLDALAKADALAA
jgi:small-conductance mechanosensitive channel